MLFRSLLMPLPAFRWAYGQRLDQTLLDVQLPDYERVLAHAGPKTVAMITSGDVLLRFDRELPTFPEVDVLGLGMWGDAGEGQGLRRLLLAALAPRRSWHSFFRSPTPDARANWLLSFFRWWTRGCGCSANAPCAC